MVRTRKRPKQRTLGFPNTWGGVRKGAGRKPNRERAGVPHRPRELLASRFPVHVTVRLKEALPSLRRRKEMAALTEAFRAGSDRNGFRLVHYAVLGNHMHLVVEGKDRTTLSRGMKGLLVRIARRLNKLWNRSGRVFADRFHEHILRTPREVRNALNYVLHNARKHGLRRTPGQVDPYSSGRWFDGWRNATRHVLSALHLAQPHTWLLRIGWRRHGLLPISP